MGRSDSESATHFWVSLHTREPVYVPPSDVKSACCCLSAQVRKVDFFFSIIEHCDMFSSNLKV